MTAPLPQCPLAAPDILTTDQFGNPVCASWVLPARADSARPLFNIACPYCVPKLNVKEDRAVEIIKKWGAATYQGGTRLVNWRTVEKWVTTNPAR